MNRSCLYVCLSVTFFNAGQDLGLEIQDKGTLPNKKDYELGLLAQPKGGRGPEVVWVPNPLNTFSFT